MDNYRAMKSTTPRRDSKKTQISLTPGDYARLCRNAPAHGVSNNRYTQIALTFFLDCEEAFGGPMSEQLRQQTVARLKLAKEKFNKFLGEV